MFEAWNSGNVDRMTEFWSDDGDWIWEDAPEIPDARVVRGREREDCAREPDARVVRSRSRSI